jgi:hypothetical protein
VLENLSEIMLTITSPPAGSTAQMYVSRQPLNSGTVSDVRGFARDAPFEIEGAPEIIVRDFEAPAGLPLVYSIWTRTGPAADWTLFAQTEAVTLTDSGDWLIDLVRSNNSRRVNVESFTDLQHDVPAATLRVLSRRDPVVVSDVAFTWSGQLVLFTLTPADETAVRNAIGNGIPVLVKTPAERGVGNAFVSVLDWHVLRVSRLAQEPARRFQIDVVQVARPDPAVFRPIAPLTYDALKAQFATYDDVRESDLAAPYRMTYDRLAWLGTSQPVEEFPWLAKDA